MTRRYTTIGPLKILAAALLLAAALAAPSVAGEAGGDVDPWRVVSEESYYVVRPENREEFLRVYRERLIPFWNEMERRGLIVEPYKLYSQRTHTLVPRWTYKTVVRFRNYDAIDRWLAIRDEVFESLFPGEGGYKGARSRIELLTDAHWDEFIREVKLGD